LDIGSTGESRLRIGGLLRRVAEVALGVVVVPLMLLFLALLFPLGWLANRPVRRSPREVAGYLRRASDGSLSERAWKRFSRRRIADKRLDELRVRAALCGPPSADRLMLRQLIKEAETLSGSARRAAS
jgi:hypothetical protein